jgi:hypothetical protein
MAWIKRNLIFVIAVAVGLGLTGYCGYLLYDSLNQNNSVTDEYNNTRDQLKSMEDKNPYPSKENIQAANADKERVQKFLTDFRKSFSPFPKAPVEDQKGFKSYLEETLLRFRNEATNANVQVPPDFGFTFAGLMGKLTYPADNIEPWMDQLQQISTILDILYKAKINSLVGLCRVPVSADDVGTGDCMLPASVVTNEWGIVTPYKVTFRGFSAEVAAVLSGFARATNCFIVQAVDVVVDASGLPTQNSFTSAAMEQQMPRLTYMPTPQPRMSDGGGRRDGLMPGGGRGFRPAMPMPVPSAPVMVAAPAAPAGPVTILSETPLLVTISVNAIKLKVSEH